MCGDLCAPGRCNDAVVEKILDVKLHTACGTTWTAPVDRCPECHAAGR